MRSDLRNANCSLLGSEYGVECVDSQADHDRSFSPLPQSTGELIQDPDFVLPTSAGPLPWRLFQYSSLVDNKGPFGYGRRASWPLRLCADVTGNVTVGYAVTVSLEREDGNNVRYIGSSTAGAGFPTTFTATSPRLFDTFVSSTMSWVETRLDTGDMFHYPAGNFASLAYYRTPMSQTVSFNYDGGTGNLVTVVEPTGRAFTYDYGMDGLVSRVKDWAARVHTLIYDSSSNLSCIWDPANGRTSFGYDAHRLSRIVDPNGFITSYGYDGQNRVTSRQVDSNPSGIYGYSLTIRVISGQFPEFLVTTRSMPPRSEHYM